MNLYLETKEWEVSIRDGNVTEYDNYVHGFTPIKEQGFIIETIRVFISLDRHLGTISVISYPWKEGTTYTADQDLIHASLQTKIEHLVKETDFYQNLVKPFHMLDYIHYELFQEELVAWAEIQNISYKPHKNIRDSIEQENDSRFTILELISPNQKRSILISTEDTFLVSDKRVDNPRYNPMIEVWLSEEKFDDAYSYSSVENWIDLDIQELIPYLESHFNIKLN